MKRYAAAYEVKEHNKRTVVKVYWARAESLSIAQANFQFFLEEQVKVPVGKTYDIHEM